MKQFITFRWILAGIVASTLLLGVSAATAKQMTTTDEPLSPVKIQQASKPAQPQTPVAGTSTQSVSKPISVTKRASVTASPVPNCSSISNIRAPKNTSSTSNPGYHEQNITEEYKVYGNTVEEINNQMFNCGPVIGSEHYAASTDYWLSWTYNVAFDDAGLCKITDASVTLTNFQVLPSWQNSNSSLSGRWNGFITNLRNHENGHSIVNRNGAQYLYTRLQQLQSDDCSAVANQAALLASQTLNSIDTTNESFDQNNNHGVTEGANL